ncbi:MAG TPA: AprI/Inh family metalloprotease inhibitor [Devosiaceae bacterium]|jgi:hypothetical protein
MTSLMRGSLSIVVGGLLVLSVSACGETLQGPPNILGQSQPSQLPPVQSSSVSTNALPPLAGSTVQTPQLAPSLTGTPVLGGVQPQQQASLGGPNTFAPDPLAIPGSTGAPGSRDLSTGVSTEKLLGGWTVTAGSMQCRLNLTYTAKAGTSHYRASAPGCQIAGLAAVSAWQLQGSQLQLFNDQDSIISAMVLSGNQFIGTVAGGTAITMAG